MVKKTGLIALFVSALIVTVPTASSASPAAGSFTCYAQTDWQGFPFDGGTFTPEYNSIQGCDGATTQDPLGGVPGWLPDPTFTYEPSVSPEAPSPDPTLYCNVEGTASGGATGTINGPTANTLALGTLNLGQIAINLDLGDDMVNGQLYHVTEHGVLNYDWRSYSNAGCGASYNASYPDLVFEFTSVSSA